MLIEKTIQDWLIAKNITGIGSNVFCEVPADNIPTNYVIIEKTGSGRTDRISKAMVAVQTISRTSLAQAASLNESVKSALYEMDETAGKPACKLNSDYNYTDATTEEYRYQAVFNLFYTED